MLMSLLVTTLPNESWEKKLLLLFLCDFHNPSLDLGLIFLPLYSSILKPLHFFIFVLPLICYFLSINMLDPFLMLLVLQVKHRKQNIWRCSAHGREAATFVFLGQVTPFSVVCPFSSTCQERSLLKLSLQESKVLLSMCTIFFINPSVDRHLVLILFLTINNGADTTQMCKGVSIIL